MKVKNKPLLRQLKCTVIALSVAILAIWLLFYLNMSKILKDYVLEDMEQVSAEVMEELNYLFVSIQEVSFQLSNNSSVIDFLESDNTLDYDNKVKALRDVNANIQKKSSFVKHMIIYNNKGLYYRLYGNMSNTGVQRMMVLLSKEKNNSYIKFNVDNNAYVGFVFSVDYHSNEEGKVVMIAEENDIYKMFKELSKNKELGISLAMDGKDILSSDSIAENYEYVIKKQIQFTPLELIVSYDGVQKKINIIFLIAMLIMAAILFSILKIFIKFWKKKFFVPIQSVIFEVESFEIGNGNTLSLTGLEHFDVLVCAINDMVNLIELKEKEIYMASYYLQESEIKKQKSLIISLKKQISAHFTVNVLTIIKALSEEGKREQAGYLCDGLSFLLRYANAGDSFINCMDEFFILVKYTDIMKIRYPNRFEVEIDYIDELENIEIPRMLIQPIIENSIIHGLLELPVKVKGKVHIYSKVEQETISIIVEDNGIGMTLEEVNMLKKNLMTANDNEVEVEGLSHVALLNIERRVRSYFGEGYGIKIESKKLKGTKVTLSLPLHKTISDFKEAH